MRLWEAFKVLHRGRGSGFSSPNPISVRDSIAIAKTYGFGQIGFIRIISAVDDFYLDWWSAKNENG